jgi:predicted dinucleotide-binding enzyme
VISVDTIAVIGAGTIGGILARKLAALGHSVRIANSKAPSTLTGFDAVGVTPAWAAEALDGADIAILCLPQAAVARLSSDVRAALHHVPIVIETGNYYPDRDGRIDAIEEGLTDSEWVSTQIGRPVFKAFNNIGAMSLLTKGTNPGAEGRIGLSVAGPAGTDKQRVMTLVNHLGFDPVDGGELKDSWRQQPGTPAYCADLAAADLRDQIEQATEAQLPSYHANRDRQDPIGGTAKQHALITNGRLRDPLER